MKLTNLKSICLIIMMSMPVFASAETKVIAHRGFWKTEGSAQNSITALKKAAEINVYGSEFDVLITSDGIPVVNHDDTIEGDRKSTRLHSGHFQTLRMLLSA